MFNRNPRSWFSPRGLQLSPRAQLVTPEETQKLAEKLAQLNYRPENGFLIEQPIQRVRS
jgi:hypothetical protein